MKGDLFRKYIERIDQTVEIDDSQKLRAYYRLFTLILEELSDEHKVQFTSLFSRIAYVGASHRINGIQLYLMHSLRRGVENDLVSKTNRGSFLTLARFNCIFLLNHHWKMEMEQAVSLSEIYQNFQPVREDFKGFHAVIEGVVISYDSDHNSFGFIDEMSGVEEWKVIFDIPHKNEIFTSNIKRMFDQRTFPIPINLIDVEEMEDKILIPGAFVIDPDYMVDVTTVANTFKYYGTEPLEAILNKFKPQELSIHLLIGNIANFLLDELINQPDADFNTLLPKIFNASPLTFSCLADHAVKQTVDTIKMHYRHLKNVIDIDFKKEDIHTQDAYLEPSYYSRTYGIQGRLDLLHEHSQDKHFDIVELKSGTPFLPNNYGLSVQHYTQTLLYDLIIKSVYLGKKKTSNYILYSKESEWNLRNAPVMKVQQYEALKIRNELVLLEDALCKSGKEGTDRLLSRLTPNNFPKAKGFTKKNVEDFAKIYKQLSALEKLYMQAFTRFIAREHRLAKTGEHGLSKSNGLAALWLEDKEEKKDRFSIMDGLEILENESDQHIPIIKLGRTELSPELVKFRKGDIVVLYPDHGVRSILKSQIFKCSIIAIDNFQVILKLRSQQYNHRIFREYKYWAIEGDMMDSSFLAMYRSLYLWAGADAWSRQLITGGQSPTQGENKYDYHVSGLTDEQNLILNRMIYARDYYLLWGPPGTGKTSIMIREYVKYLFHHTDERVLLVAYTNRAVDELCDAVLQALPDTHYPFVRIGSSNATDEKFTPYLLDQTLHQFTSRQEILAFLKQHRIIISTLASIQNRTEIFHLYQFDTLIIDEASQILEPMLVGLLPKFKRWLMIGDHKQLPAVVVQDPADSRFGDELLISAGIVDGRMSLFERLYHRCQEKGWEHACGILTAQGRMHHELMAFPNACFYENRLRVISSLSRLSKKDLYPDMSKDMLLPAERLVYIPTGTDKLFSWKTNQEEAEKTVLLVRKLLVDMSSHSQEWTSGRIGIITPYRAQIALISSLMTDVEKEKITVDTVERYQGGARDIIILSLCTNRLDQIERLVSLSEEGIDRKLNVALTRARERIFILGNQDILHSDPTYKQLLEACFTLDLS